MAGRFRTTFVFALIIGAGACGAKDAVQPAASATAAPAAGTSAGTVDVSGKVAGSLAPPESLLTLVPKDPIELPVKSEPAVIDQAGYEFLPAFLIAQAGQHVQFKNSEDVLHNVRVTEATQQKPVFNVATVAFGKYEHTFEPGLYNVTCDIHPTMRATILVTATPYAASAGTDGTFAFSGVKPGAYTLTIYGAAGPIERSVDIAPGHGNLGTIQ